MVDVFGWLAAALGCCISLPQLFRLVRTRTVAGVSLVTWQLGLGANLAWASHGFITGHVNMWLPNLVLGVWTVLILTMFRRHTGTSWTKLLGPGLALAGITTTIDLVLGPVTFAAAIAIPSLVSMLTQLTALARSPELTGVSSLYYVVNVVNQGLWLTWAFLIGEQSVVLAGSLFGFLWLVGLTLLALRRMRLVGPTGLVHPVEPVAVGAPINVVDPISVIDPANLIDPEGMVDPASLEGIVDLEGGNDPGRDSMVGDGVLAPSGDHA